MQGFSLAPLPAGDAPVILALDTTAGACSVAVLRGNRCEQRIEPLGPTHSRRLLGMVQELMVATGVTPTVIDAIAFGAGPGSFTGLRVACGVAQGLGLGWGRALLPVGSMATLAWLAFQRHEAGLACIALDARMGEVYRSAWRREGERVEWVLPPEAVAPARAVEDFARCANVRADVRADVRPVVVAGDAFASGALAQWLADQPRPIEAPADAIQPQARAVACLGAQVFLAGLGVDAADAAPIYVRDKVALDVDEQAALRARRAAGGAGR